MPLLCEELAALPVCCRSLKRLVVPRMAPKLEVGPLDELGDEAEVELPVPLPED